MMTVAILALQGAFAEHQQMLERLGAQTFLVRNARDWQRHKDALVIPGGESTTMLRLLRDLDLYQPVREAILNDLPVLGTCAGLIMLDGRHLDTMHITVRRNAYGRQLGSFNATGYMSTTPPIRDVPMVFIRAPYIESVGEDVDILATLDGNIIAAKQGKQIVTAFHPELTSDTRIHELFMRQV